MGSLSREQVDQFEDQGYLVVQGLFDPKEDLDPVIEEYQGVLDRLVDELFEAGRISSRYEELSFGRKMIKIQQETGEAFAQNFDFSLPPRRNIKGDTPLWLGEGVFNVLSNPRLLDAVESIIGSEIYASPVQHVRMKMPEHEIPENLKMHYKLSRTEWHQDNGVLTEEADETDLITVWFPLWDAPIRSGPLQVQPYSHRRGLLQHCPMGKGVSAIPKKLIDEMPTIGLPMNRGDALFMHRRTAHASLPNQSDDIRWSFDLRYHPVGQATGREEFPGFVARSRKAPETELHDHVAWAESWLDARARLSVSEPEKHYNRWDANSELCA